jgi:hypothetical protein
MLFARNDREPHRRGIDGVMETLRVQRDAVEEMWGRLADIAAGTFQLRNVKSTRWLSDGVVGRHRSGPKTSICQHSPSSNVPVIARLFLQLTLLSIALPDGDNAQQCVLQA